MPFRQILLKEEITFVQPLNKYLQTYMAFSITLKVRDYECDLQGIVNNANYQHYLEHARHEFLHSYNVSFAELHKRGIDAVVARLTMAFKTPLTSGDSFRCTVDVKKEGIKYVFTQNIYRLPDEKLSVKASVETVCLINGRLKECEELDNIFFGNNSEA